LAEHLAASGEASRGTLPEAPRFRHTFASLLIQQGESLAYVRDQMGRHSIKITVDIYGHPVPGANKAAVDRLDDASVRNLYATAALSG
jgi:integrase